MGKGGKTRSEMTHTILLTASKDGGDKEEKKVCGFTRVHRKEREKETRHSAFWSPLLSSFHYSFSNFLIYFECPLPNLLFQIVEPTLRQHFFKRNNKLKQQIMCTFLYTVSLSRIRRCKSIPICKNY